MTCEVIQEIAKEITLNENKDIANIPDYSGMIQEEMPNLSIIEISQILLQAVLIIQIKTWEEVANTLKEIEKINCEEKIKNCLRKMITEKQSEILDQLIV